MHPEHSLIEGNYLQDVLQQPQALAETFDFGKDKTVRFARHAYLGWILAYVVEKSRPSK